MVPLTPSFVRAIQFILADILHTSVPTTGYGAAIDINTGSPNLAFAKVNGNINAVVPDGAGGWYIGGNFTMVGGVARNNIAHINADGTLNGSWNPNANNVVSALKVSGSTVYVSGMFTSIGGQTGNYIAALDVVTGTATSWNPNANNFVNALCDFWFNGLWEDSSPASEDKRGTILQRLMHATGTATSWDPNANNSVYALAVSGSTVYAGGVFTSIGGQTRNRIAAIDTATGTADKLESECNRFFPNVYALAVSGSTVYAGGGFTSIGGQTRNRIAAIDTATGTATSWNPNASGSVNALAVSGSTVYVCGGFTSIGGQTRNHIAALDASTGNATSWNPNAK